MAKKTMLEQAQKAYKKGKSVREKQKKKKVVTTERPEPKQPAKKESKQTSKPSQKTSSYKPSTPKTPVKSKSDLKQQYKSFQASPYKPTNFAAKTKKYDAKAEDRKSTRLNSSHFTTSRMPSSA